MKTSSPSVRIGCGSAYAEDRIDLAMDMLDRGRIKYLCMDALAERTLALAHQRRDPVTGKGGFDVRMPQLAQQLLPLALERGVTIVNNMGAADPEGAGAFLVSQAKDMGLRGVRFGVITGDDVTQYVREHDPTVVENGRRVSELSGHLIAANAYIGADAIMEALTSKPAVVLGGRIADPSLFVAPICYEFGWKPTDWDRLGAATAVGHLLECGNHVTGGNFADPPYRVVPSFDRPSFPLAEVWEDGTALVAKLPDTDGLLSVDTCRAQIAYEILDPANYLTPDVSADFCNIRLTRADGGVAVAGASGRARPELLKALVAMDEGFIGEGQVGFAGPGAASRARLGAEVVRKRVQPMLDSGQVTELRVDLMGIDAFHGPASVPYPDPYEVHLRVTARAADRHVADAAADATWYLQVFGPAATGGHRKAVRPVVGLYSFLLSRSEVKTSVQILES